MFNCFRVFGKRKKILTNFLSFVSLRVDRNVPWKISISLDCKESFLFFCSVNLFFIIYRFSSAIKYFPRKTWKILFYGRTNLACLKAFCCTVEILSCFRFQTSHNTPTKENSVNEIFLFHSVARVTVLSLFIKFSISCDLW